MKKTKIDFSDILFITGGLAVCAGTGLIYLPAGVILLGIFLILSAAGLIKPK